MTVCARLLASVMVGLENVNNKWFDWTLVCVYLDRSLDMDCLIR